MKELTAPDPKAAIRLRYGQDVPQPDGQTIPPLLGSMLARGSCRTFKDSAPPDEMIQLLCAAAFAAPTKSDLQQRDVIILKSPEMRKLLAERVADQSWVAEAPMIAVFCGNNRRQRALHDQHQITFANDHLDAFFNAATDAAIALGAFVTAAEALGLGCCPISGVRNEAGAVSELLGLPDHVFPFAGLAFGHPATKPQISHRLPLRTTCHVDRYSEVDLTRDVEDYDRRRALSQPYEKQRFVKEFGSKITYTWSDDKVRQYSKPERADFGNFVRSKGFKLD